MTAWNEQYRLGNAELDRHHEHIVGLIGALESAAVTGEGAQTADLVVTHLLRYLSRHFEFEERRMAEHRYSRLAAHRLEHASLHREVRQMARDIAAGRLSAEQIRLFVRDWLDCHVRTFDRDYSEFLRQR